MDQTLVGRMLGPYQLQEIIGQGGIGAVYRAHQPSVQRDVAIKILSAPLAAHPAFLSRFGQEIRAIARLQHPHILPVHDVGLIDGQPYLVMAYMPGGALSQRIAAQGGGLPLDEVVRITAQIASALDCAHRAGIVHRDLKPGNILLDAQGNAYLADFGLAQIAEAVGLEYRQWPSTLAYTAPEVMAGDPPSPASDIYALGLVAFEMITARRLPQGIDAQALLAARGGSYGDIRSWRPDVPRGVGVAIAQALSANPAARPPLASSFANALGHASGGAAPSYASSLTETHLEDGNGSGLPPSITLFDNLPDSPLSTPVPSLDTLPQEAWQAKTAPAAPRARMPPPRPPSPSQPAAPTSSAVMWIIGAGLGLLLVVLFMLVMVSLAGPPPY